MEKVLLAIDGVTPDKKAFNYAVEFCKRIRAELHVLQVVRPKHYSQYVKKARNGVRHARRLIEDSMVAATLAEVGAPEMAKEMRSEVPERIRWLLTKSEAEDFRYRLKMRSGSMDKEISEYLNTHRDIVLTIYDPEKEGGESEAGKIVKQALSEIVKGAHFRSAGNGEILGHNKENRI